MLRNPPCTEKASALSIVVHAHVCVVPDPPSSTAHHDHAEKRKDRPTHHDHYLHHHHQVEQRKCHPIPTHHDHHHHVHDHHVERKCHPTHNFSSPGMASSTAAFLPIGTLCSLWQQAGRTKVRLFHRALDCGKYVVTWGAVGMGALMCTISCDIAVQEALALLLY